MTPPRAGADIAPGHPVILFDARCVLCSANARFVLRHDRVGRFRLAAMQGEAGARLYHAHGMDPADPSSILVIEHDRVRRDSDAVLAIYEGLGWPWRGAGLLRVVPAVIRDPVYRWVARHRYRLFGRRDECWVALPHQRDRIL